MHLHPPQKRSISDPNDSETKNSESYHHDESPVNWFANLDANQNKQAVVILSIFLFISVLFLFVLYNRYRQLLKKYLALKSKRAILTSSEENSKEIDESHQKHNKLKAPP